MDKASDFKRGQAVYYSQGEERILSYIIHKGKDNTYRLQDIEEPIPASALTSFSRKATSDYDDTKAFDAFPSFVQVVTATITKDTYHLGNLCLNGKAIILPIESYVAKDKEHKTLIKLFQDLYVSLLPLTKQENIAELKKYFNLVKSDKGNTRIFPNIGKLISLLWNVKMGKSVKALEIIKQLDYTRLMSINVDELIEIAERNEIHISNTINILKQVEIKAADEEEQG